MTARISIRTEQVSLQDAWGYYRITRQILVQAAEKARESVLMGSVAADALFFGMEVHEAEAQFRRLLQETDEQACLFLIAAAEAALRVDFLQRVYERRKDGASRRFRAVYNSKPGHRKTAVTLDEDILEVWAREVPQAKSLIGDFRGALNYRHWLAHGRYWVPKMGRRYDPNAVLRIIMDLFSEIGVTSS